MAPGLCAFIICGNETGVVKSTCVVHQLVAKTSGVT
jgi:hypothetical protein